MHADTTPHRQHKIINSWWPSVLLLLLTCLCGCALEPKLEEIWRIPYDPGANLDVRMQGDSLLIKTSSAISIIDVARGKRVFEHPGFHRHLRQLPSGLAVQDAIEFRDSSMWVIAMEAPGDSLPRAIRINLKTKDRKHYTRLADPRMLKPSKRPHLLFYLAGNHFGLYDDGADTLLWENKSVTLRGYPMLLEDAEQVFAADHVNNNIYSFDLHTGQLLHQFKLPVKEFGLPFGGLYKGIGEELLISEGKTLMAISIPTGSVRWQRRNAQVIHRFVPLPLRRYFVFGEHNEAQVVELSDGSVVTSTERYSWYANQLSDPSVHPQNGRITFASSRMDRPGVVVLDPATLDELFFIPGPSEPGIGPILWGDLLIHFPAGEHVVRAVRLPA